METFTNLFQKWSNFPPLKKAGRSKSCAVEHVTVFCSSTETICHTHCPCSQLWRSWLYIPCLWLYWSFVILAEWNWYFLTKCNLLEQTSSQVLMKRIQGNGHCGTPQELWGQLCSVDECFACTLWRSRSLLALCLLIKNNCIFTY